MEMDPSSDKAIRTLLVDFVADDTHNRAPLRSRWALVSAGVLVVALVGGVVATGVYMAPFMVQAGPASTVAPSPYGGVLTDWTNPGTLVIEYDGIGPLRLRESTAQVVEEQSLEPTMRLSCATDYANGASSPVKVSIGDIGGSVGYIDVIPTEGPLIDLTFSPRTSEGIGLGSNETDLLAAYPSAEIIFKAQEMTGSYTNEYLVGPKNGNYLHIVTNHGIVSEIRLDSSPKSFLENPTTCQ